jgi:formamidopyrimidine-DNA glycosylase
MERTLTRADIAGPFLLRSERSPAECVDRRVTQLRRIGKRIAIGFDNDCWLVLHLMIAGRLHWSAKFKKPDGRRTLAAFSFDSGCLTLTEAGTRKRASLHVVHGESELAALDPGGLGVLSIPLDEFARVLTSANHTLKRSLTDPRLFSGIGNAYSDEILHRARLSPILLTSRITPEEIARLHAAVRESLTEWTARLRAETGDKFPEKVTAFRPDMAVHGKYGQPCPVCGSKVQRIRYASNETNYCPTCQTGGRLLADRALSRLLREDWPRTPEELEQLRRGPSPAQSV